MPHIHAGFGTFYSTDSWIIGDARMNREVQNIKLTKNIVIWICLAQLLTAFVGRSLAPLMVYISSDLSLNKVQLGFLPTALFIGQSVATLPTGLLADWMSIRKMMLSLMVIVGIGFLCLAWTDQYFLAILCVIFAGVGYGGMHPVTNKVLVNTFVPSRLTLPMGLKQMSITLGSALASLILIPLVVLIGWRYSLSLASIILILIALLVYFKMSNSENLQQNRTNSTSLISNLKILIRSRRLLVLNIVALILMGVQVTFNTFLILFLYEVKGWTIYYSGTCLAISELSGALGRILWGVISDRYFNSNRWIVLLFITLLTLGSFGMLYVMNSPVILIVSVIIIGFSLSGFNGVWMNAAVESLSRSLSGSASGYSIMVASVGVFFIPPIFSAFIEYNGYGSGGIFLLILLIICGFILLFVKKLQT